MEFIVVEEFDWAHRGVDIMTYKAGDTINTEDPDLIRVATDEKWIAAPAEKQPLVEAEALKQSAPEPAPQPEPEPKPEAKPEPKPQPRARKNAPENKAATAAPENK
ncbi:MAG: hypothetical protein V4641_16460 [Pseudomonadota bacterium]